MSEVPGSPEDSAVETSVAPSATHDVRQAVAEDGGRSSGSSFLLIAGVATLLLGVGQYWHKPKPLPTRPSVVLSGNTAHVAFAPMVMLLDDPSPRRCRVRLQNPWSEAIDVESIQASSSCSDAKIRDRRIPPGASTELDLLIRLPFSGSRRNLQFTILAKPDKVLLCTVPVQALQRVHVVTTLPDTLAFGDVHISNELDRSWPVYMFHPKGTEPNIKVVGIHTDDDNLRFDLQPVATSQSEMPIEVPSELVAQPFELKGHLSCGRRPGFHQSSLRIVYRTDGREHERRLFVTWRVIAALQMKPQQIVWNVNTSRSSGRQQTARVVISSGDGTSFRIKSVRARFPWIDAEYDGAASSLRHEVVIRLREPDVALRDGFQEVVFSTDHPRQPEVRLSVAVVGELSE